MNTYDRGYTEITFSRIAVLTEAREGIIHKEYHLSSGDPKIIGADRVEVIGNTNYDVADQLSAQKIRYLANAGVEILGLHKCMRQVDIQFVVEEDDFKKAICALHQNLVEDGQ